MHREGASNLAARPFFTQICIQPTSRRAVPRTPSLGNEKKRHYLFWVLMEGAGMAHINQKYIHIYLFGKSFVTLRYLSVRAFV